MNRIAALILFFPCLAHADRDKLAVMPLQTHSIDLKTKAILDDLLVADVDQLGLYDVVGTNDINAMLGLEQMKEALGCSDTACAAEIGGALGVAFLLVGTVDTLGENLVMTLTLLDTLKSQAIARRRYTGKDDVNRYPATVDHLIREVFLPATSAGNGAAARGGEAVSGVEANGTAPAPETRTRGRIVSVMVTLRGGEDYHGGGALGEYRIRHRDWLSTRLRAGAGAVNDGYETGFGLFLGLGEQVSLGFGRDDAPAGLLPQHRFELYVAQDVELGLVSARGLQFLTTVGARAWWLFVELGAGYGVFDAEGLAVGGALGAQFAF